MSDLNITVLQETLHWMDGEPNLCHFDAVLAGITGCNLILLPEMFTTGFAMEAAQRSLPQAQAQAQAQVVAWLHKHTAASNALVGGSAAIQTENGAVNRFLLVEPDVTLIPGRRASRCTSFRRSNDRVLRTALRSHRWRARQCAYRAD
nr:Catalase-peroxidase [Candidatus Pantoea persica]